MKRLGSAARAAGSHDSFRQQMIKGSRQARDEDILYRPAWGHGGQHEALDRKRRQVLEAVHGDIGLAGQHRALDFLREHPLATYFYQQPIRSSVARRFNLHNFD